MQKEIIFRPEPNMTRIAAELLRISLRLYREYRTAYITCEDGIVSLGIELDGGRIQTKLARTGPLGFETFHVNAQWLLAALSEKNTHDRIFVIEGNRLRVQQTGEKFTFKTAPWKFSDKSPIEKVLLSMRADVFARNIKDVLIGHKGAGHVADRRKDCIYFHPQHGGLAMVWTNGITFGIRKEHIPLQAPFLVYCAPLNVLASLGLMQKKNHVEILSTENVMITCGPITVRVDLCAEEYFEYDGFFTNRKDIFTADISAADLVAALDAPRNGALGSIVLLEAKKGNPHLSLMVVTDEKSRDYDYFTNIQMRHPSTVDFAICFDPSILRPPLEAFGMSRVQLSGASAKGSMMIQSTLDGVKYLVMPKLVDSMAQLQSFIQTLS